MGRLGTYLFYLLDFLGFVLKAVLALIFGDFADMFSKGGRIWLIPIVLGSVAFIYVLAQLGEAAP